MIRPARTSPSAVSVSVSVSLWVGTPIYQYRIGSKSSTGIGAWLLSQSELSHPRKRTSRPMSVSLSGDRHGTQIDPLRCL